jgi:hypothetical protein
LAWRERLGKGRLRQRLEEGDFKAIAADAMRIESRTNLLFSFEKMALRDAVAEARSAREFANGLYEFLYGESQRTENSSNGSRCWADCRAGRPEFSHGRRQPYSASWPSPSNISSSSQQ